MSPTNSYINNWHQDEDQSLLDDLMVEAIQFYGFDCHYIPRTVVKKDVLYLEDTLSQFTTYYLIEMYLENTGGFEGPGDLLTKFGVQITDQFSFMVSQTRFHETITTQPRPNEGDLIYLGKRPFGKLFEIKHVEHEQPFYQIGDLKAYKLQCELFRYSHERFSTGVPDLDEIQDVEAYAVKATLDVGTGDYVLGETVYQGSWPLASLASGTVVTWDATNRELVLRNITGSFSTGRPVIGVTSGASASLSSVIDLQDNVNEPLQQNTYLENERTTVRDFSEDNPFSEE